jgi:hypothetical protein
MRNATTKQAQDAVNFLVHFIGRPQLSVMCQNCRGEEGQYFRNKLVEMSNTIKTMPKTYEQDGKGDQRYCCPWLLKPKKQDPAQMVSP